MENCLVIRTYHAFNDCYAAFRQPQIELPEHVHTAEARGTVCNLNTGRSILHMCIALPATPSLQAAGSGDAIESGNLLHLCTSTTLCLLPSLLFMADYADPWKSARP